MDKKMLGVAAAAALTLTTLAAAGEQLFSVLAEGEFVEQQSSLILDAGVTEQVPDFGFETFDALLKVDEFGDPNTFGGTFTLASKDGELSATVAGVLFSQAQGLFALTGPFKITGGTGAFEFASGSGLLLAFGFGDEAGAISIQIEGVILNVAAPCPADLDGDNSVGFNDLTLLLGSWGPCPAEGSCDADIDGDDSVGFNDLTLLLGSWGPCPD